MSPNWVLYGTGAGLKGPTACLYCTLFVLCAAGPQWAAVPPGPPVADQQVGGPSDWNPPREPRPVQSGPAPAGGCGGPHHWGLTLWRGGWSGHRSEQMINCLLAPFHHYPGGGFMLFFHLMLIWLTHPHNIATLLLKAMIYTVDMIGF